MKLELEHVDICKAISFYLSESKNFEVSPDPANFKFTKTENGELEVVVRNGDMVSPRAKRSEPQAPPARPQAAQPKSSGLIVVPPVADRAAHNYRKQNIKPNETVPEPNPIVPPKRIRNLDVEVEGSPILSQLDGIQESNPHRDVVELQVTQPEFVDEDFNG